MILKTGGQVTYVIMLICTSCK